VDTLTGRRFIVGVLKSARSDNALWLLAFAFCVQLPLAQTIYLAG
jgi:hypothetical protein